MYVVKFGTMYLGAVDTQKQALRFAGTKAECQAIASALSMEGTTARIVKLKTIADRTAASMRGLASDIEGDNGGGPS